jgi:hypothetical protein
VIAGLAEVVLEAVAEAAGEAVVDVLVFSSLRDSRRRLESPRRSGASPAPLGC